MYINAGCFNVYNCGMHSFLNKIKRIQEFLLKFIIKCEVIDSDAAGDV